jgi:hypothetical protein
MVKGFIANEYGDTIIASLQTPYNNTLRIIDWDILAGIRTRYMTGSVTLVSGQFDIVGNGTQFMNSFQPGDVIIIGNITYTIDTIVSPIEMTVNEPIQLSSTGSLYYKSTDANNFFEYEYRWSHTNDLFSEFQTLNSGNQYGDLFHIIFDTSKPMWIEVKNEVAGIIPGNTITLLSITYTIETVDGTIESCPNFCTECTDPFSMTGCANIEVACTTSVFNPYALTKSVGIYKQLTNIVNDIFGHSVNYFRIEPNLRTTDVILMEYSLHNVVDNKTLKILVPDNEFPSEANSYDIFGIDLADFEVHITADEFENKFGAGKSPRNKDYMFIPIINKMYEISSVSLADEFNKTNSYWRVKLVKYQDRSDVIKGQFNEATDILTTGIEEIFGERIEEEYVKHIKKEQFQTVTTTYQDGIREFVNKKIRIVDYNLKNRWTIVSKNYYDFTAMRLDEIAIVYTAPSTVNLNENMAFTGWFSPQFKAASTTDYYLFGDNDAIQGLRLTISNTEFKLSVNGITESFTHGISFNKNNWYTYVINVNNSFLQLGVSFYSLNPDSNVISNIGGERIMPASRSNNLVLEFNENRLLSDRILWNSVTSFSLRSNEMFMTNIRVFNTPIEEEEHSNVLNQYLVRDNQYAIVIDNAIPSLGFQKFANAR